MGFTLKQKEYFKKANHRWGIKSGATRSGKTYMDYFLIPKRIRAVAGKDGLNVLLGNTKGTLQRNIIEPLQNIWGLQLVSDIKSDNTAMMFGEKVYCLGADKVSQANRIRGSSIKYCYGDEIVTWNQEVFDMLKSRLDREYSKFDGTCNPDNPFHWFKQFLDTAEEKGIDLYLQNYCIDDNPYCEIAEQLKKEYAGTVSYDRYVLGLWALAEGLIYPMFDKKVHVVPTIDRQYTRYYISMDYGTLNATSMGLWGLCDGVWYKVKEYYHSGRDTGQQKTDEEYYAELVKLAGNKIIQFVIIDPSAASFIAEIRSHGKFRVKKAENSVLDGIRFMASQLQNNKVKYNGCCTATIKEFGVYAWDEKASMFGVDKPIKENDHCMDSDRYFLYTVLGKKTGLYIPGMR